MTAILYSEANLLCISFLLLIYFKLKRDTLTQNERNLFRCVLLSNCFFFTLDALWAFVDSQSLPLGIPANRILNMLYYITSGVASYLWFLYSENVQQSGLVGNRKRSLVCALPMLALAVLSVISVKTGWLFYIDEFNVYHRGPLYALQLLMSYGYVVFTATKALILSERVVSYHEKSKYRTLAVFVMPTIVAGAMQTLLPGVSLLCIGTTFGILYVFITMQERMISADSLTGLNNRSRMTHYLCDKLARHNGETQLYLVMMDMDHFKQVNDVYGHVEGDNALIRTASALKKACDNSRCMIARYGGDEFAAICEFDSDDGIEAFCRTVRDNVRVANKDAPYAATLSIGYAKYHEGIKTDKDFIEQADAALYRAKLERQAKRL